MYKKVVKEFSSSISWSEVIDLCSNSSMISQIPIYILFLDRNQLREYVEVWLISSFDFCLAMIDNFLCNSYFKLLFLNFNNKKENVELNNWHIRQLLNEISNSSLTWNFSLSTKQLNAYGNRKQSYSKRHITKQG